MKALSSTQFRDRASQWLQQSDLRAFLALATGLVAISFAPIFIRLSELEITPYATIFHRSWMAALIFLGLRAFSGRTAPEDQTIQPSQGPSESVWKFSWGATSTLLLLLGTTFAAAVLLWAWALTQTTVANSTLLHSFTPLFTGIFAWLIWGQRFGRGFWTGMAIATLGAIFLAIGEFSLRPEHLWGDAASLLSAVFFSTEPLLVERLRARLCPNAIMFWCFALVTVLTLPFLFLAPAGAFPTSLNGWLVLLAMAIICQAIGHGLLTYCLKYISAGVVSLSHLSVPIFSAAEAWLFFSEPLTGAGAIAFATVLGGIAYGTSRAAPESGSSTAVGAAAAPEN